MIEYPYYAALFDTIDLKIKDKLYSLSNEMDCSLI